MALWTEFKNKLAGGERVTLVWSREHDVELVDCTIDPNLRLVRDKTGRSWPKPDFDPKPSGKERLYLALGEKIVPWPTREKSAYDVLDDGTRIEITPEYLDQLTRDTDTEAWLRGVRGMSLTDRLIHLGAGAAIGMVLTFFLLRLVGFVASKSGGSGTTVTITNATTNATALATAVISAPAHLASLPGAWPF
jgi:hypothetical protein